MSGWLTNGVSLLLTLTGNEQSSWDTLSSGGVAPETGALSLFQVSVATDFFTTYASKTTVAGSIYYTSLVVTLPSPSDGVVNLSTARLITGLNVLVGSVGGTDTWAVGLYNSAGVLVANSALAGVTAGTTGTWQQFAFTTPYSASPGVYYAALQTNGTTAHPSTFNFPAPANPAAGPIVNGSQTGTFGTLANIGTISTTYTQNLGPVVVPY